MPDGLFGDIDMSWLDDIQPATGYEGSDLSNSDIASIIDGASYAPSYVPWEGGEGFSSPVAPSGGAERASVSVAQPVVVGDRGPQVGVPDEVNRARDSQQAYSSGAAYATQGAQNKSPLNDPSVLEKIVQGLGLKGDVSNPRTLDSWMKFLLGGAQIVNALFGNHNPKGYKSASELRDSVRSSSGFNTWNPQQQQWANNYFYKQFPAGAARERLYAADMPSSVRRGYAHGGALSRALGQVSHGSSGSYVQGSDGGQDDTVPANLSPGEYVWDADTVSALGDGNNAAGARVLDQARESIRAHKRSAPPSSIPPKAKALEHYMPKGALSMVKGEK